MLTFDSKHQKVPDQSRCCTNLNWLAEFIRVGKKLAEVGIFEHAQDSCVW